MLNELKIKYFLILADSLNFSAAAKSLHITQQALSKQISIMEQELDCVLFHRSAKGVALTEAGEIMQKTFCAMKRSLELAMVEIHNNERNNGHVLNIGCAAGIRIGPFFYEQCEKFKRLTAQPTQFWFGQPDTYNDLISWMLDGKFDLILCTDDYCSEFADLEYVSLCRTPFYFFVSKTHPLAAANTSLKNFKDMPFYLTGCDARTARIIAICQKEHFFPNHICNTANPYSTHLMVETGTAITFGSGFSTLHNNPSVRAYSIPEEEIHLFALYSLSQATQLTMQFVDFLRNQCSETQWYHPSSILP